METPQKERIPVSEANLNQIIETVSDTNEPIVIEAGEKSVVVVSEDEWESIQETLYLQSIPGYMDKFHESLNSPPETWVDASSLGLL